MVQARREILDERSITLDRPLFVGFPRRVLKSAKCEDLRTAELPQLLGFQPSLTSVEYGA